MSAIAVIVPARNEAPRIAGTLAPLRPLLDAGHEIIVVDGGSSDRTAEIAAPHCSRVLSARRGRATQMNAGAHASRGDVLVFVHADTRVDPAAILSLSERLARTGRRWGRFDVRITGRSPLLPIVARAMNLRSRVTGIATGDQAMFVARETFDAVGGFPEQPLMEDVETAGSIHKTKGQKPKIKRKNTITRPTIKLKSL